MTFENVPLSAITVYKYDNVTGEAISGAVFEVRYLTDTSGTGGTAIGRYKTGANGSFTVTGLVKGAYIVEELASDSGHVIDTAPQTAFLSGEDQDVVQLYFGNQPKGAVLIRKIDGITHAPLAGVQFYITDSTGAALGNANGYFTTDSAGTILLENLAPSVTVVAKETRAISGYNTCWVGATFRKVPDAFSVYTDEKLVLVIAIGYGETQGKEHKPKAPEAVSRGENAPEWFVRGVEAALLAPTAMNQQKFFFTYRSGAVSAKSGWGPFHKVDLGIAKLHFELGSGKDRTVWL